MGLNGVAKQAALFYLCLITITFSFRLCFIVVNMKMQN